MRIVLTLSRRGAGARAAGLAAGAAALLAAGCAEGSGPGSAPGGERLTVAAGFYPLAYAAEEIGSGAVEVTNLTPAGAEPHDVELSVRDVERVRAADVVLLLGEAFQPALAEAARGAQGEVVDLLAAQPDLREGDPHVWLDPLRYADAAARIGEALGRPAAAERLRARLAELDGELERGLAECERRDLVTAHDAFGYLAARYGLEVIPIAGVSPEAEPPPRQLERIAELVRERGVTTVFVEPLLPPEVAETVAREAGAETAVLNPLEGLTPGEVERGEDYFSVMRANLETLRAGLRCR